MKKSRHGVGNRKGLSLRKPFCDGNLLRLTSSPRERAEQCCEPVSCKARKRVESVACSNRKGLSLRKPFSVGASDGNINITKYSIRPRRICTISCACVVFRNILGTNIIKFLFIRGTERDFNISPSKFYFRVCALIKYSQFFAHFPSFPADREQIKEKGTQKENKKESY